jgi:hypothetical protein
VFDSLDKFGWQFAKRRQKIIFIAALQSVLYLAIVYLIAIDNFTLTKAAIAITLIKVMLIFFAYALFFLFLIVL